MANFWKIAVLIVLVVIGYSSYKSQVDTARDKGEDVNQRADNEASSPYQINKSKTFDAPWIAIPQKFQVADAVMPIKAKNDEELRNSYGGTDRLTMDEFYKKFDQNIISFKSQDQYDWLVKNGYPMPEEVVAGYKMSIDDLGKLVDEGNVKASYFYLMREVYNVDSAVRLDRTNKGGIGSPWSKRYVAAENAIMKSG